MEKLIDIAVERLFKYRSGGQDLGGQSVAAAEEDVIPDDPVALTFARFDADGGGAISRRELRKALESLGVNLGKRAMKQLLLKYLGSPLARRRHVQCSTCLRSLRFVIRFRVTTHK